MIGWCACARRNMHGKVLHGYDRPVYGKTAEERLDIRAASKTDKFCKARVPLSVTSQEEGWGIESHTRCSSVTGLPRT